MARNKLKLTLSGNVSREAEELELGDRPCLKAGIASNYGSKDGEVFFFDVTVRGFKDKAAREFLLRNWVKRAAFVLYGANMSRREHKGKTYMQLDVNVNDVEITRYSPDVAKPSEDASEEAPEPAPRKTKPAAAPAKKPATRKPEPEPEPEEDDDALPEFLED